MTMIKPHVHVETRFDQRTRIYALRMYVRASMQSITPVCAHGRRYQFFAPKPHKAMGKGL